MRSLNLPTALQARLAEGLARRHARIQPAEGSGCAARLPAPPGGSSPVLSWRPPGRRAHAAIAQSSAADLEPARSGRPPTRSVRAPPCIMFLISLSVFGLFVRCGRDPLFVAMAWRLRTLAPHFADKPGPEPLPRLYAGTHIVGRGDYQPGLPPPAVASPLREHRPRQHARALPQSVARRTHQRRPSTGRLETASASDTLAGTGVCTGPHGCATLSASVLASRLARPRINRALRSTDVSCARRSAATTSRSNLR